MIRNSPKNVRGAERWIVTTTIKEVCAFDDVIQGLKDVDVDVVVLV